MWSFMVTFASTIKPRSLTVEESEIFESPTQTASPETFSRWALDPHKMASVFSSFSFSLFEDIHVLISRQQSSIFCTATSAEAWSGWKLSVRSTIISEQLATFIIPFNNFPSWAVYNKNCLGPRTEPCGTQVSCVVSEDDRCTVTWCDQSAR